MDNKIKSEIEELYDVGKIIKNSLLDKNQINYQVWYSKCLVLIKQLNPDRYDEFVSAYGSKKENGIHTWFYSSNDPDIEEYDYRYAINCINTQLGIVKSTIDMVDFKVKDIVALLESELFDEELDSAKNLLKKGYLRAAGAICGVVLENHFKSIMKNHNLIPTKKDMSINDYNDLFRKENIYDVSKWRNIQYLGDLRNLCDHSKDREPTNDDVEELINGTSKIIKTVF